MDVSDRQSILAPGDMLGCYRIISFLGQGGFGVTYVARDTMLDIQVAIKEYLPERIAERGSCGTVQPRSNQDTAPFGRGLANFLKEARTLARFNHPNIVRVMSVFEQHGTAYMVMEYERGHDLKVIFNQRENINESLLKTIVGPVLDGLKEVHRHGFIHRDIKPANILVRDNGTPVLLDFGSARLAVGHDTEALTAMVTAGFAPLEQYSGLDDQQGPWTDVYALGAVLYYAVTGSAPPDSTLRASAVLNEKKDPYHALSQQSLDGYSRSFCRAVDWALQFRASRRPQTLDQWRSRLFNDESIYESTDAQSVSASGSQSTQVSPTREQDTDPAEKIPDTEPLHPSAAEKRPLSDDDKTVVRPRPVEISSVEHKRVESRRDDTYELELADVVFVDDEMPSGSGTQTPRIAKNKEAKRQSYLLLAIAGAIVFGATGLIGVKRWQKADDLSVAASTSLPVVAETTSTARIAQAVSDGDDAGVSTQNEIARVAEAEEIAAQAAQARLEAQLEAQLAAEKAEAERNASLRAARLEADRAVQREEARRQAQLQEQREAEIAAERQQKLEARREAERQAEVLREAAREEAAADLAFERNAVKPLISANDFSDVLSRFNALSNAIEQRDSAVVKEITVQSDRKTAYFDYAFRTFDKIEVDLSNIRASRQDQTIRASLLVKRMIRNNGDIAIPPEEFRNIPIYSVKETTWSAIHW